MNLIESTKLWAARTLGGAQVVESLLQEVHAERSNSEMLQENLADLSLALDSQGWIEVSNVNGDDLGHQRLRRVADIARTMYYLNPTIRRPVNVTSNYVWALGLGYDHEEEDIKVKILAFVNDLRNQMAVFGVEARSQLERELQLTGNVYFAVVPGDIPTVRTIPFNEIREIISDPDDPQIPMLYRREYTNLVLDSATGTTKQETITCFYYDAIYKKEPLTAIGNYPVHEARIVHVAADRTGDMRFSPPEVMSGLQWARAYKSFLENWSKILQSYATLTWKYVTGGGKKATKITRTALNTSVTTGSPTERNPTPTTGAMAAMAKGDSIEALKTSGMTTSPEEGRRIHLMTVASTGLPETFWGDVMAGSEATATSLDRPTELFIAMRQIRWKEALIRVISYALKLNDKQRVGIRLKFPQIVGRNIRDLIGGIVDGATMKGLPMAGTSDMRTIAKLILTELGVEDAPDIVEKMYPLAQYDYEDWSVASPEEQIKALANQQNKGSQNDPNAQDPPSNQSQLRAPRTPGRTRPNDNGPR